MRDPAALNRDAGAAANGDAGGAHGQHGAVADGNADAAQADDAVRPGRLERDALEGGVLQPDCASF